MIKFSGLLLIPVCVLSACAHKSSVFLALDSADDNEAIVYVYRPNSLSNIVVSPDILIDGKKKFESKNNTYMAMRLPAGEHQFRLDLASRYQGQHSVSLNLLPMQQYFIRVDTRMKFQKNNLYLRYFDIFNVSNDIAVKEIKSCRYIGKRKLAVSRENPLLSSEDEVLKAESKEVLINDTDAEFSILKTRDPFAK